MYLEIPLSNAMPRSYYLVSAFDPILGLTLLIFVSNFWPLNYGITGQKSEWDIQFNMIVGGLEASSQVDVTILKLKYLSDIYPKEQIRARY